MKNYFSSYSFVLKVFLFIYILSSCLFLILYLATQTRLRLNVTSNIEPIIKKNLYKIFNNFILFLN